MPSRGCEGLVVVLDVAVRSDATVVSHANGTEATVIHDVRKAAVAFAVHRLGEVDLPAQSIVDGQLGGRPPGILPVEEPPLLPLGWRAASCGITGVAGKIGDF